MASDAAFGFFSEDGLTRKSHPTEPAVQVIARTDRSPRNSQPVKQERVRVRVRVRVHEY